MAREKKQECPECVGSPEYMLTYGDMMTLLLVFFVTMFSLEDPIDPKLLQVKLSAFVGVGDAQGGLTLQKGPLAEMGNSIDSLPSMTAGRATDRSLQAAISLLQPEITAKKVRVVEDERGLVISMNGDTFFPPGSAELNMDEARPLLQRLSSLLTSEAISGRQIRIEGHSDNTPLGTNSPFPSNWELSTARATNVLRRLLDYQVPEKRLQVAGYADTRPVGDNNTAEGRAYNRRVDIVVLTRGHL